MLESPTNAEELRLRLRALKVPPEDIEDAVSLIPVQAIAILVYGSRARDDFTSMSDLDLLALVEFPVGTESRGRVHLSFYTPEQLATAAGTLYGMHLARDGVIVHDTDRAIAHLLNSMGSPDPNRALERVRRYSAILDVTPTEQATYLSGLCRMARYLLRTAIYATALLQGNACFSVRELAVRFHQPELSTLLSSDPMVHGEDSPALLNDLRLRLVEVVKDPASNPFGSLRSLIVSEWESDSELATLATLVIARQEGPFDYVQLPKVLL